MVMTDPIAELLTRIRNAIGADQRSIELGYSRTKENIVKILKKEGYISDYTIGDITDKKKKLVLFLRYDETHKNIITGLVRVSKPGRRIYSGYKEIPRVLNGFGVAIVSTSKGILTDRECRVKKIGGEVLCYIW